MPIQTLKEIRTIRAEKNKNLRTVIYSVHRPMSRQRKLDAFVMSNYVLTLDDLYKLSYSGGLDRCLIACCRRTGKKFIKRDRNSWNIK